MHQCFSQVLGFKFFLGCWVLLQEPQLPSYLAWPAIKINCLDNKVSSVPDWSTSPLGPVNKPSLHVLEILFRKLKAVFQISAFFSNCSIFFSWLYWVLSDYFFIKDFINHNLSRNIKIPSHEISWWFYILREILNLNCINMAQTENPFSFASILWQ